MITSQARLVVNGLRIVLAGSAVDVVDEVSFSVAAGEVLGWSASLALVRQPCLWHFSAMRAGDSPSLPARWSSKAEACSP